MNIFNFINKNGNDILHAFNDKEKKEFLELLKLYKIYLRQSLQLDNAISFGFEFEFSTLTPKKIESMVKTYTYKCLLNGRIIDNGFWNFKEERTVSNGYEVTTPIFRDTIDVWKQINEMCDILLKNDAITNNRTAGHIHIGTQILGDNPINWLNFMKLYIAYENIMFRFGYGEYEKERLSLLQYSNPLSTIFLIQFKEIEKHNYIPSLEEIITRMRYGYKKYSLDIHKPVLEDTSFKEGKTIEFRSMNASLNPVIWQNNLNFLVHFLEYAKNMNFDNDTVNRRIQKRKKFNSYNEIDIEQAMELADMIFDNNLDKINFLRQYLKSFITIDEFITTNFTLQKK